MACLEHTVCELGKFKTFDDVVPAASHVVATLREQSYVLPGQARATSKYATPPKAVAVKKEPTISPEDAVRKKLSQVLQLPM